MYTYYESLAESLSASRDLNFLGGTFSSVCLNTGDNVATKRHRDLFNLLLGLCLILVLGNFDSTFGGHLVLEEAQVIVELARGDMFFLPSAMFTHSNTPIKAGDTRNSMAYWTSGNVFLWAELDEKAMSRCTEAQKAAFRKRREGLLAQLLSHFPVVA